MSGYEIVVLTERGAVTLTPTVIPNPGGMITEVDGVTVKFPDGATTLLPIMDVWQLFGDNMNELQKAHLMGWPICCVCRERGITHDPASVVCWTCRS